MTKIAIILPVYEADNPLFFEKAVKSVLCQSVDFQIFICQDGKLSLPLNALCQDFSKNKTITLVKSTENKGLPTVLNRGIRLAIDENFEFIARMDADDICEPDRLAKQLEYFRKHANLDVLGSNATLINEAGDIIGTKMVKPIVNFNDLKYNCEIVHPSVMFRSAFFEKFGFYDESLLKSQDYELWLRASKNGAIIKNLSQNLLQFRYESKLISRRKKEQWFNIKIKFQYLNILYFIPGIIRHLFILICPTAILKWLLNKKVN